MLTQYFVTEKNVKNNYQLAKINNYQLAKINPPGP